VEEYQAILDVVGVILRERELRPLFRAFVDWYVDLNRWMLAPFSDDDSEDDLDSPAMLTYAVSEGLAVCYQASQDVDVGAVLRVWEAMVCDYMGRQCPKTAGRDGPRHRWAYARHSSPVIGLGPKTGTVARKRGVTDGVLEDVSPGAATKLCEADSYWAEGQQVSYSRRSPRNEP